MCAGGIFKSLTRLINLSRSSEGYPSCWKMANVIPIFKKENRQMKTNFRPVSLLVSLSKVCEKVVFVHVYKFFEFLIAFNLVFDQVILQLYSLHC